MKNKTLVILVSSFMAFILIFSYGKEYYMCKKLEDSSKSLAIITRYSEGTTKHGKRGYFEYKINQKIYTFIEEGDFSDLKIGDTVEIKISNDNNSIAEITSTHYMDKYK